jgi:hypothetical protein
MAKFINNQVSAQGEQRPVRELHNIGAVYKPNIQRKKKTQHKQHLITIHLLNPTQKGILQIPNYQSSHQSNPESCHN